MILPQLGSPPAIAVFTNGELAIEKAIFFASFSVLQFCILIVINLDTPSPSATTLLAKFNKTLFNDSKLEEFEKSLNQVLLNLAKRVVVDGEGASKFITINVENCKTENDAKKIAFSIANSPLVKTAIAGEDPNWGRIIMAIGKAGVPINFDKLSIRFGEIYILQNGKLNSSYKEQEVSEYMKNDTIDININIFKGSKNFKAFTMDLTKKYIDINADYRS